MVKYLILAALIPAVAFGQALDSDFESGDIFPKTNALFGGSVPTQMDPAVARALAGALDAEALRDTVETRNAIAETYYKGNDAIGIGLSKALAGIEMRNMQPAPNPYGWTFGK